MTLDDDRTFDRHTTRLACPPDDAGHPLVGRPRQTQPAPQAGLEAEGHPQGQGGCQPRHHPRAAQARRRRHRQHQHCHHRDPPTGEHGGVPEDFGHRLAEDPALQAPSHHHRDQESQGGADQTGYPAGDPNRRTDQHRGQQQGFHGHDDHSQQHRYPGGMRQSGLLCPVGVRVPPAQRPPHGQNRNQSNGEHDGQQQEPRTQPLHAAGQERAQLDGHRRRDRSQQIPDWGVTPVRTPKPPSAHRPACDRPPPPRRPGSGRDPAPRSAGPSCLRR